MSTNPAKAEALAQAVPFDFNGQTYVIARENIDDLELFEKVEDGNYVTAVRGFLGQEQWETFKETHRGANGRVTMTALAELLDVLMERVGNLSASPDSSGTTAGLSKPTSSASTESTSSISGEDSSPGAAASS